MSEKAVNNSASIIKAICNNNSVVKEKIEVFFLITCNLNKFNFRLEFLVYQRKTRKEWSIY